MTGPGLSPEAAQAQPAPDPAARFEEAEQRVGASTNAARSASDLDDFDRSVIAKGIIWIYGAAVGVGLLLFCGRAIRQAVTGGDDWEKIASDASDLIKTSVLPIVTLVLGYYFGKSKS